MEKGKSIGLVSIAFFFWGVHAKEIPRKAYNYVK